MTSDHNVPNADLDPSAPRPASRVRVGVNLFSVKDQGWTALQMLDWAARCGVQVVHFSEVRFLGSLDAANLRRVRAHADELGLDLEVGTRSICPTSASGMFDATLGTGEAQLTALAGAAAIVRSPIVRCVLGSFADRRSPGGIQARIADTIKVLRNVRSRFMDAGVKVAIENHAGDMQARELKALVEAAGPEFVGVTIDSGNAVWAIEDPHLTLEVLAPYVQTSHIRDSRLWMTPDGIAAAWTRMGDGNIGMEDFLRTYVTRCPGKPVSLEVIVHHARMFNYADPAEWDGYRDMPAWEFARFIALAEKGTPPTTDVERLSLPDAQRIPKQLEDAEASIRWTKAFLATL